MGSAHSDLLQPPPSSHTDTYIYIYIYFCRTNDRFTAFLAAVIAFDGEGGFSIYSCMYMYARCVVEVSFIDVWSGVRMNYKVLKTENKGFSEGARWLSHATLGCPLAQECNLFSILSFFSFFFFFFALIRAKYVRG